jgi:2-(1,2-epoxy-1,2-dihydrophenyl)acetyl-CoA isomerase
MSDSVLLSIENTVATLTLNRPAALNALDFSMMDALVQQTLLIAADPSVRCVVLTGAGDHFMAGGDIKAFATTLPTPPAQRKADYEALVLRLHAAVELLNRIPAPVVAKVRGACAGFGLSLMAGCDLAIAADSAYFTTAYRTIGLTPDGGGTYFLPRLLGTRRAMELFLLSPRLTAARAMEIGLVSNVVPMADLDAAVQAVVANITNGPRLALGNAKRLVYQSAEHTLSEQLRAEAASFSSCAATNDFAEGITAFVEKRKPVFGGDEQ